MIGVVPVAIVVGVVLVGGPVPPRGEFARVSGVIVRLQETRAFCGSLTVPMTGIGAVRLVPSLGRRSSRGGERDRLGSITITFVLAVPRLPAASLAWRSRSSGRRL